MSLKNAFKDPIHGWIRCSKEEMAVIDCEIFQRLRHVSQLTATDSVFLGGTHSRFIHSLGVMTIAGKMMKHLLKTHRNFNVDIDKWVALARMAGLLHDIGHGPFSHAFDRIVYSKLYDIIDGGHDRHRLYLIQQEPLKSCIINCGISIEELHAVWEAKASDVDSNSTICLLRYIASMCVSGPLGADRIDFVLRDSYFTGTEHLGTIAWERIVYNSRILFDTESNVYVLAYAYKTLHDIIQALDGRRYMYHGVYLNKTVDAASLVVEQMLMHLNKNDDIDFIDHVTDVKKFAMLNDATVKGMCMFADKGGQAKMWCERYFKRELPKMLFEELVDANVQFDEDEWKKGCSHNKDNVYIRRTRCITGIDPSKFNEYHVRFYNELDGTNDYEIFNCEKALGIAKFKSIDPYYIVRGYC